MTNYGSAPSDGRSYVTLDLGGSRLKAGLFGVEDNVLDFQSHVVRDIEDTNDNAVWTAVVSKAITDLMKGAEVKRLSGIAVSYAGPVGCKEKKIYPSNGKYMRVDEMDLSQFLSQWTDNYVVDNDARMACVGEWQYGAGKGYSSLVTVTLGTGIGTSVVINNKILRGEHDLAGCLGGHFSIALDGRRCTCGNMDCVEAHASTSVLNELQDRFIDGPHVKYFKELFERAESGEPQFKEAADYIFGIWGRAVVTYIHAYDPSAVVLTGGVVGYSGDYIPSRIQRWVDEYAWQQGSRVLVKKGYSDISALYGGAYFLFKGEENVVL